MNTTASLSSQHAGAVLLVLSFLVISISPAQNQGGDYVIGKGDQLLVTVFGYNEFTTTQTVKDNDKDFVSAADMLKELREDNLKLVETLRAAKEAAEEAGDNATDGLIDDWTDQAEERAWFLFETSRGA